MQPDPVERGVNVPEALIKVIDNHYMLSETDKTHLIELIRERDELGRSKYGQPLMSQDGRSGVQDALEELGDLLQYAMKCKLNGSENVSHLRRMIKASVEVLNEILKQ